MVAAVKRKRRRKTAAAKAVGGGEGSATTDGGSTESTVLLESWSNVDSRTESADDMQVDAAAGAESTVGRMQMVEEAINEAADLPDSAAAGVLPPGGGVQQRLERERDSARLEYARQMLWEEDYSSEGASSDGRVVWRKHSR